MADYELDAVGLGVFADLGVELLVERQENSSLFLLQLLPLGIDELLQFVLQLDDLHLQALEFGRTGRGATKLHRGRF